MVQRMVPVTADGTQICVEISDGPAVETVGLDDMLSFDGVRDTIEAIARELAKAWEVVRPDEAKVEFGLKLTTKTGKLTGLLVEGGGEASLNVALTWKRETATTD